MREIKYFCNGCNKQVDSANYLMDFVIPSPLAGGSARHVIHDRCSDCSKPIYKALDKVCRKFGY